MPAAVRVHDPLVPTLVADLPLARRALDFAHRRHAAQRRASDGAPYIVHPLEVAALLRHTGHAEWVIGAALLHDVVEDTGATVEQLTEEFGAEVAGLVAALTEDASIADYAKRKDELRRAVAAAGAHACAVYAADKVAKVRELRAEVNFGSQRLHGRRLTHYEYSLAMLETQVPRHPLVAQLRFELEVLESLPPG